MFEYVFKNFFKIVFSFIIFFSCTLFVEANTFDNKRGKDVYVNCNSDSKCIPLCVYQDSNGNDVGLIGYYYDSGDWEVAFRGAKKYSDYNIYFITSSDLIYMKDKRLYDIYDGKSEERVNWRDSDTYKDLKNNFSCPSRMYIDESISVFGYNELCFENHGGDCRKFNDGSIVFESKSLSYSFKTEYSSVLPTAYESLRDKFSDDNEEINKEKVKFLSILDSGYKYDATESAKQNAANNCSYLMEKANEKYQEYMKTFANEEYIKKYVNNYLNPSIQDIAVSKNVRDLSTYNFATLSKIVGSKNLVMYEGGNSEDITAPIIEMFNKTAYNKNVKEAINFISNFCTDEANYKIDMRVDTDGDGVIDSDDMNNIIDSERESFDIRLFFDPVIQGLDDPDKLTYSCNFLTDLADIISTAYFIIEMVGLAILVVFTSMDYIKIFLNDNADELKKANSNFLKRLIIAIILFLLPAFVNFTLRIFKIEGINSEHPLCVQISNK